MASTKDNGESQATYAVSGIPEATMQRMERQAADAGITVDELIVEALTRQFPVIENPTEFFESFLPENRLNYHPPPKGTPRFRSSWTMEPIPADS